MTAAVRFSVLILCLWLGPLAAAGAAADAADASVNSGARRSQRGGAYPWYDAKRDDIQAVPFEMGESEPMTTRSEAAPEIRSAIEPGTKLETEPGARPKPAPELKLSGLGNSLRVLVWIILGLMAGAIVYLLVRLLLRAATRPIRLVKAPKAAAASIESLPFPVPAGKLDLLAEARRHYQIGQLRRGHRLPVQLSAPAARPATAHPARPRQDQPAIFAGGPCARRRWSRCWSKRWWPSRTSSSAIIPWTAIASSPAGHGWTSSRPSRRKDKREEGDDGEDAKGIDPCAVAAPEIHLSLRERVGVRGTRGNASLQNSEPSPASFHPNPLPEGEGDLDQHPPAFPCLLAFSWPSCSAAVAAGANWKPRTASGAGRGRRGASTARPSSARCSRQAGHKVSSCRTLSPRLTQQADCIVWFPDDFRPPSKEVRRWLEDVA